MQKVLIADDEESIRYVLRKALEERYETQEAADGDAAVGMLDRFQPDLVVVDLNMPGRSGLQVLSEAHRVDPMLPVVIITGYATLETAVEALRLGAYDYIQKPIDDLNAVRAILNHALETRRLRMENQRLLENLQAANAFRARLMSAVAHDLKGMLTGILGYTQMARMVVRSEGHRELSAIHRVAGRMKLLADDLITYGTLEARAMRVRMEKVGLDRMLRDALESMSAQEARDRVQLPETGASVYADSHWTTQILTNLLENAVKYSPPGTPIAVHAVAKGPMVEIAVEDRGPGVPPEAVEAIFEPFYRARPDDAVSGSGLGLAIVKDLVEMQKGRVWVENLPTGARFCFTLLGEPPN